jgi:hypothetical protein
LGLAEVVEGEIFSSAGNLIGEETSTTGGTNILEKTEASCFKNCIRFGYF